MSCCAALSSSRKTPAVWVSRSPHAVAAVFSDVPVEVPQQFAGGDVGAILYAALGCVVAVARWRWLTARHVGGG
jgi:hypothetical protein